MSQDLLKKVYLFEEFPNEQLAQVLELGSVENFQKGDEIFAQNDEATAMYFVKFGTVRIFRETKSGDKIEVAQLGSGSHFGEMAMIDGEKRSATAEALEKTEILRIRFDQLRSFLEKKPELAAVFYKSVSKFLSGRLRQTTTDLSFARELNLRHF